MKNRSIEKTPVVLLCGGKGTRLGPLSRTVPKPLLMVGDKPILWHVMKIYASQGFSDFILCLGHKKDKIESYFKAHPQDWRMRFVDTGVETSKSRRVLAVKDLIESENFFLAYGDDVADIDLSGLLRAHKRAGRIATVTAVRMTSPFGLLQMDAAGRVVKFREKPELPLWMNGGFMCMNRLLFDHLKAGELENEVFEKLVRIRQIGAWRHKGQWKTMNTLKDNMELTSLWRSGRAFWKTWSD